MLVKWLYAKQERDHLPSCRASPHFGLPNYGGKLMADQTAFNGGMHRFCGGKQRRRKLPTAKFNMRWMEVILSAFENPLSLTHRANRFRPLRRITTLNGPRVHRISPVGKEKVYGGNDLPKSQVLSSEWKIARVREDESGDSEDGPRPRPIHRVVVVT